MLNQKICFVDFSEQAYTFNSLYTEPMPRSQLDLLYLASALTQRPNQVTVISDRPQATSEAGIEFLPLPEDAERYWSEAEYDIVIGLDSLEAAAQVRPWLPEATPLLLWSHLSPRHVSLMPLQHASVRDAWQGFVMSSYYLSQSAFDAFGLEQDRCYYRWPAMVRSLRKRFTHMGQLATSQNQPPTLVFTAAPSQGLLQVLEMQQQLRERFPELRLRVLQQPGTQEADETEDVQEVLQRCRSSEGVEVFSPMPWPSYAEKLVGAHILCHPLNFCNLDLSELIDALSAGCVAVLCEHPGLREVVGSHAEWLAADPADDYFERYQAQVAELLERRREDGEAFLERSFRQMAHFNTYCTWDLRVWEWESLFYEQTHPTPRLYYSPPVS